jgi:hypothetical protein
VNGQRHAPSEQAFTFRKLHTKITIRFLVARNTEATENLISESRIVSYTEKDVKQLIIFLLK